MPFKNGQDKIGGRIKGTPNKLTQTVKERVLSTFDQLQETPQTSLFGWAKTELTEFYKISAKLIPQEINANIIKIGKDLEDEQYED